MDHQEGKASWQEQIKEEAELKARPSRARYDRVHAALERRWRRRELKADRMMKEVVDELWDTFAQSPYAWCGFYLPSAAGDSLILGAHRDKPACSPLPLHGVCGKVFRTGLPMIVPDIKALGEAHVECDPKNLSEIALPVFDHEGKVWAVFDADSESAAAFDDMDARWLERILKNFQEVGRPE